MFMHCKEMLCIIPFSNDVIEPEAELEYKHTLLKKQLPKYQTVKKQSS